MEILYYIYFGFMCCPFASNLRNLLETSYVWPTNIDRHIHFKDSPICMSKQPPKQRIHILSESHVEFDNIF